MEEGSISHGYRLRQVPVGSTGIAPGVRRSLRRILHETQESGSAGCRFGHRASASTNAGRSARGCTTVPGAKRPRRNQKGTSSYTSIYSSLPRHVTNTEQTNTLVEQIRETSGKKVGNFTITYPTSMTVRRKMATGRRVASPTRQGPADGLEIFIVTTTLAL